MPDDIAGFFFNQGILGVIIIVLGTVIVLQDKRYRTDLKEKDTMIALLQEKRANDAPIYADKFAEISEKLMGQLKDLLNINVANQKAIETIATILQNLRTKI